MTISKSYRLRQLLIFLGVYVYVYGPTRRTFGILFTDSSFEINLAPTTFLKLKTTHSKKKY